MEANTLQPQLRIGNYLQDREGNLCKATQLGEGTIYAPALKGAITKLPNKPIPLSEEWLLKLGFEKDDNGVDMFDQDYCEWYQKDFPIIGELCQSSDKQYLFNTERDDLKIYYLHQLQNLYFALTNLELTIKE